MSRKRKALTTAGRLARIRDKIADRARGELLKIDNGKLSLSIKALL